MKINLMAILMIVFSLVVIAPNVYSITIVWNEPSANGTYYWQNFKLNVTTDINANCSYWINYSNGTNIVPETWMGGNETTEHTADINVDALPHGYVLNISVFCMNSTESTDNKTEQKWFYRDYDCGDSVHDSWTLGHDIGCSGTALNISEDNVTLSCNGHTVHSDSSAGIQISSNNDVVRDCALSGSNVNVFLLSGIANATIVNNTLSNGGEAMIKVNKINGLNITQNTIQGNYQTGIMFANDATNVSIVNNTFTTTSNNIKSIDIEGAGSVSGYMTLNNITGFGGGNGIGIYMYNPNTDFHIYKNWIYGNDKGIVIANPSGFYSVDYNEMGNYWGYNGDVCPGFIPGVDSNSTFVVDRYPYTDTAFTNSACDCGDVVTNSVNLYKDVTCTSTPDYGLYVNSSYVMINCSGYEIKNNVAPGTASVGVYINKDNVTISNCGIHGFSKGVYSANTTNLSIFLNDIYDNYGSGLSGIAFINVNYSTIMNNNIHDNDEGIYLKNCTNVTIYRNNIYNNNHTTTGNEKKIGFNDAGGNTNITNYNNYWGHSECSLFLYGRDSNTLQFIDYLPVSQMNNWSSYLNCTKYPTIHLFNLTKPDGSPTDYMVVGHNYIYDENNQLQPTPFYNWQYFYYPGDSIIYYINISQWNYKFNEIDVESPSLTHFNLTVENLTGINGTNGLYKFNITFAPSDLNLSNPEVNNTPPIIEIRTTFITSSGAVNTSVIYGFYNFTPTERNPDLGGSTTDWSTISDFTNVSGLTFEIPGKAKILFKNNTNLADTKFVHALRNLEKYIKMSNGSAFVNSTILSALNKSATVWFYNLSFDKTPGLLMNGNPVVLSDGSSYKISDNTTITGFHWNETSKILRFNVTHWSEYDADGTPPELTITVEPSTIYVGTDVTITCSSNEPTSEKYVKVTDPDGNTYSASEFTSPDTAGTYTVTCKAKDLVGLQSEKTIEFTVHRKSSGGGSSNYVPPIRQSFLIINSVKGKEYKTNFTNNKLNIVSMKFTSVGGNCEVTVEKLMKRPDIPKTNRIEYAYFDISGKNVENVTIEFKVSKKWTRDNNVDPNSIILERYHGKWMDLDTELIGEDNEYYYYISTTPGFSYFIVSGENKKPEDCRTNGCPNNQKCEKVGDSYKCVEIQQEEHSNQTNLCGNGICDNGEDCENCIEDCPCAENQTCENGTCVPSYSTEKKSTNWTVYALILVVAVIVAVVVKMLMR